MMRKLASDMERLVAAIRQAAATRRAETERLRAGARAGIAVNRARRRENAPLLRQALHAHVAAISMDVHAALQFTPSFKKRATRVRQPDEVDEERLLREISSHPAGIWMVDLGNKLGVDWRVLTRLMTTLVEAGKVEQMEQYYFPVGG